MEFFNKKQDVIDVQLTSYGKQLLSRGLFKPVYYAFSDDNVLYDGTWAIGSGKDDSQSYIEQRIQEETPRLKALHRKVGTERAIFNSFAETNLLKDFNSGKPIIIDEVIAGVLETSTIQEYVEEVQKIKVKNSFAESEKLLENLIGTKPFLNNLSPAFNTLFYQGEISSSAPYYKKKDVFTNVPQINCQLKDVAYRMDEKYNPFETLSQPVNFFDGLGKNASAISLDGEVQSEDQSGFHFEKVSAEGGNFFVIKDYLFLSLEEQNVDFLNENFMIEVYEVTTKTNENGEEEEELEKMYFMDETDDLTNSFVMKSPDISKTAVESVFNIETDGQINATLACYLIGRDKRLKSQNIYMSNVYDCDGFVEEEDISIDPYTALPEVEPGEVC
tara:strand:- start:11149 stop:12312 length:1164 start_codon:yes stop_codon:yes gene_type:complete